ncbi:hypothetical protein D3C87_1535640 [compost metagenome]
MLFQKTPERRLNRPAFGQQQRGPLRQMGIDNRQAVHVVHRQPGERALVAIDSEIINDTVGVTEQVLITLAHQFRAARRT